MACLDGFHTLERVFVPIAWKGSHIQPTRMPVIVFFFWQKAEIISDSCFILSER